MLGNILKHMIEVINDTWYTKDKYITFYIWVNIFNVFVYLQVAFYEKVILYIQLHLFMYLEHYLETRNNLLQCSSWMGSISLYLVPKLFFFLVIWYLNEYFCTHILVGILILLYLKDENDPFIHDYSSNTGRACSSVEYLHSMYEVLGSIPNITKIKKKTALCLS